MEHKLRLEDVLGLENALRVGSDILLLPEQSPLPYGEALELVEAGVIPESQSIIARAAFRIFELGMRYEQEISHGGGEPSWIQELPRSARSRIRFDYHVRNEDSLFILPSFMPTERPSGQGEFDLQPTFNAGLSFLILDNGLCRAVYDVLELYRLEHIKQLGFLQAPVVNQYFHDRQSLSDSSRLVHSLHTYVIATVIGNNVGLGVSELNTLSMLALSHDIGTPAGGDSVKLVAPHDLDEDKNYRNILEKCDLRSLVSKYDIQPELLWEGIHNRGLLGEILDIADKLAYIAWDISRCLHHIEAATRPPPNSNFPEQEGLKTLLKILHTFPYVCGIWDSVEVEDGHAVFTNLRRLIAFLKVRILMFRELYYHPTARFGEFLMSRLFVKVLWDEGVLTKEGLLNMTDGELLRVIDNRFGEGLALDLCSSSMSRVQIFKTLAGAKSFICKLEREGKPFSLLDDNRRAITTGARFLVKTPQGPKALCEADPGTARELEEMARMLPLVHVYYLDGMPNLPKGKVDKLVEYLNKSAAR